MDVHKKSRYSLVIFIALFLFSGDILARGAAPSEVISDVSVIKRKGKSAIKVDFAFPVRYVSHDVLNRGIQVIVNLEFNSRDVPDQSQLPLLQTRIPADNGGIPIEEVTYETTNEGPKLNVRFSEPIDVRVSQVMGVNSIVFFVPEKFADAEKEKDSTSAPTTAVTPGFFGGFVPEPAKSGKAMEPQKLEELVNKGKTYLRNGEAKKAIDLFSSLLSLPEHEKTMECLELLGLARERNGQEAHAKTIYEEYLKRYPKDKSTDRIKQRLADLSQERQEPKQPLKKSDETRKSKFVGQSFVNGSIAQYYDGLYIESVSGPNKGNNVKSSSLDTQFNVFHRKKTQEYDWRNSLVMSEKYYQEGGAKKGVNVGSLYTKYKDNHQNYGFTLGRHTAPSIPGVLGKFDGVDVGAQATDTMRLNIATGYPVSWSDKQHIQTDNLFKVFNLDVNDLIKGWDISPFVATEKNKDIVTRSAYGTDLRYFFEKGELNFFVEYDRVYAEWVKRSFQSNFKFSSDTSMDFSYDEQKNVNLENALSVFVGADELQDILNTGQWTTEDLAALVKGISGSSKVTTFSINHSLSKTLSLNVRWAVSISDVVRLNLQDLPVDQVLLPENYDQYRQVAPNVASNDLSVRMVTSESFHPRDSTIISFGITSYDGHDTEPRLEAYNYSRLVFNYRRPFGDDDRWRSSSSLTFRSRSETNTANQFLKIMPKQELTYNQTKNMHWTFEFSVESTNITEEITNAESASGHDLQYNLYCGYVWEF